MSETRKLAAILVADVVGFSRLAAADEDRTLSRLRGLRSDLIDPAIVAHRGRVVKRTGDGALVEFRSVVDSVRCAIEVQTGMIERNAGLPPERRTLVEELDDSLVELVDPVPRAGKLERRVVPLGGRWPVPGGRPARVFRSAGRQGVPLNRCAISSSAT